MREEALSPQQQADERLRRIAREQGSNGFRLAIIAASFLAALAGAAAYAWLDPFDLALVGEALMLAGWTAVGCAVAHGIRRRYR